MRPDAQSECRMRLAYSGDPRCPPSTAWSATRCVSLRDQCRGSAAVDQPRQRMASITSASVRDDWRALG